MIEINEIIQKGEIIEGYRDRMLLEAKEKEEKDYIRQSLDHGRDSNKS